MENFEMLLSRNILTFKLHNCELIILEIIKINFMFV